MTPLPPIPDAAHHEEAAHPSQPRPQFNLRHLFAAVTIVGLIFGAVHWLGLAGTIVLSFIVGAGVVGYRLPRDRQAKPLGACAGLFAGTVLVFCFASCLLPAVSSRRGPSYRSMCRNNLRYIGIALQNYADDYNCFPPAYIADKGGRPMHSWRVLLLPYLERQDLYANYRFDEPWDGPHNRLLANHMPDCYHCYTNGPRGTTTSYVAITGPETLLGEETGASFADIEDGTSTTLAVVEVAGSAINWMEPRDLPFAALDQGINLPNGGGISSAIRVSRWWSSATDTPPASSKTCRSPT